MTKEQLRSLSIGTKVKCIENYTFEGENQIRLAKDKIYTIKYIRLANTGAIGFLEEEHLGATLDRVCGYLELDNPVIENIRAKSRFELISND